MPNPDRAYENQDNSSSWLGGTAMLVLIILWIILVLFGMTTTNYKNVDNSPACRYDGDCDYPYGA